jgi:branched-chain amino acid transport system ATP-binding protein
VIEVAPQTIVAVVGHDGGPARFIRPYHGVGYVPPGRRVFGSLTVEENLAVGAYNRPKDFEALYARFPLLRERRTQSAGTLSGGEQQLLVIARALAGQPDLLVLEDPSAGLAPPAIEAVAQAIAGLTVLIADESLALATQAADRIVLVERDAIVLDAPRAQALADERLGTAYVTGPAARFPR